MNTTKHNTGLMSRYLRTGVKGFRCATIWANENGTYEVHRIGSYTDIQIFCSEQAAEKWLLSLNYLLVAR